MLTDHLTETSFEWRKERTTTALKIWIFTNAFVENDNEFLNTDIFAMKYGRGQHDLVWWRIMYRQGLFTGNSEVGGGMNCVKGEGWIPRYLRIKCKRSHHVSRSQIKLKKIFPGFQNKTLYYHEIVQWSFG